MRSMQPFGHLFRVLTPLISRRRQFLDAIRNSEEADSLSTRVEPRCRPEAKRTSPFWLLLHGHTAFSDQIDAILR